MLHGPEGSAVVSLNTCTTSTQAEELPWHSLMRQYAGTKIVTQVGGGGQGRGQGRGCKGASRDAS